MKNDIQIIIDQIHSKIFSDEDLQNWLLDNRGIIRFNALLIIPYINIKENESIISALKSLIENKTTSKITIMGTLKQYHLALATLYWMKNHHATEVFNTCIKTLDHNDEEYMTNLIKQGPIPIHF